jgi:hypothetical protein
MNTFVFIIFKNSKTKINIYHHHPQAASSPPTSDLTDYSINNTHPTHYYSFNYFADCLPAIPLTR